MPLFGPPNIENLKAKHDLQGLVKALSYKENSSEFQDVMIRNCAAQAIGDLGDTQAVELIFAKLLETHGGTGYFEAAAIKALAGIGKPALESLITGLGHPDARIRVMASGALEEVADSRSVEPLLKAIQRDDKDVLGAAVRSLGKIGDKRAVEPLLTLAQNKLISRMTRIDAVRSLGDIGDRRGATVLRSLLEEQDDGLRTAAAASLGQLHDPLAVEPLISLFTDKDWSVQKAAAEALEHIGAPAVESLIAALRDKRKTMRTTSEKVLIQIGAPAIEPFRTLLTDNDSDIRNVAIRALGQIGSPDSSKSLLILLKDEKKENRRTAAEALEKTGWKPGHDEFAAWYWVENEKWDKCVEIGDPAVEPLITVLKEKDVNIREKAVMALGEIGNTAAIKPLIAQLKKVSYDVVMQALIKIGEPGSIETGIRRAVTALNDRRHGAREAAAQSLVNIFCQHQLPDSMKKLILVNRTYIIHPHEDAHSDSPSYCREHEDVHTDFGIGVDFPL